jgi:3-oxoacyl-[acyl-carrier protein] reductase
MNKKDERWALVTGAGRGIGRAVALELAGRGYHIFANYHRSKKLVEGLLAEIEPFGVTGEPLACDISQVDQVKKMFALIHQRVRCLDVLVNNAAILKDCAIYRMNEDDWHQVIDTNLNGTYNCSRAAVFAMIRHGRGRGRIINISSLSSFYGGAGQTNYAASKAGIIGFSRCLAVELARYGITVNVVIPGLIPTDMIKDMPEEKKSAIEKRIPMGRVGTEAEIAAVVSFIASSKSSYMTGQVITVDGGLSCAIGG